jgi:hypothetical protein
LRLQAQIDSVFAFAGQHVNRLKRKKKD